MRKFLILNLLGALVLSGCNRTDQTAADTSSGPLPRNNAALGFRVDLKEKAISGGFTALSQVTLTPDNEKLVMQASGIDPSVGIPPLTVQPGAQFALRIEQDTPTDTLAEIFYTTATAPGFTAKNVVSLPIKAGRGVLLFEINDPDFAGGLRYDPGQATGDYILHQIEALSSEPVRISVLPPASSPSPTPTP